MGPWGLEPIGCSACSWRFVMYLSRFWPFSSLMRQLFFVLHPSRDHFFRLFGSIHCTLAFLFSRPSPSPTPPLTVPICNHLCNMLSPLVFSLVFLDLLGLFITFIPFLYPTSVGCVFPLRTLTFIISVENSGLFCFLIFCRMERRMLMLCWTRPRKDRIRAKLPANRVCGSSNAGSVNSAADVICQKHLFPRTTTHVFALEHLGPVRKGFLRGG